MKWATSFCLLFGLFLYLSYIDMYEFPAEVMESGKGTITKSAFYDMVGSGNFFVDGAPVTGRTFTEQTPGAVYLNGKVHLMCDLWAWGYYCWELLLIALLCAMWYKTSADKFFGHIALFCSTAWLMRLLYQLLLLFNLIRPLNLNQICKECAVGMLGMLIFYTAIIKIKKYAEDILPLDENGDVSLSTQTFKNV